MQVADDYSLFRSLFKKYRLRSEIETISKFADLMAEKGLVYDESLFSHWQKGTRIPKDRKLLLMILELFVQKGGVKTVDEAHLFLAAAGLGNLTPPELKALPSTLIKSPFLVPQKGQNILIREKLIHEAIQIIDENNIALITGVAGAGKTIMAIELSHRLRHLYPDGVVWFRLNKKNTKNILYSLAQLYNYRIDYIYDKHTLSSLIRSFLHPKRILYIFDNAEFTTDIHHLLPSSQNSGVIITSQTSNYNFLNSKQILELPPLSEKESRTIFHMILGSNFVEKNADNLEEIARIHGYLPLAVQIAAKQLSFSHYTPREYIDCIKKSSISLDHFTYEDTNLMKSLDLSYTKLTPDEVSLLNALTVFAGQDFPIEAVAYILNLKLEKTKQIAIRLTSYSLLERSGINRYRLHPVVRSYLTPKLKDKNLYIKAANFYTDFIEKARKTNKYYLIETELESISNIFILIIRNHIYEDAYRLFEPFGTFLWNTGKNDLLRKFIPTILNHMDKINDFNIQVDILSKIVSWYFYYSGEIEKSKFWTEQALKIAKENKNSELQAFTKERLGKIYQAFNELGLSELYLKDALIYFSKTTNKERMANINRYLGETYLLNNKLGEAYISFHNTLKYLNSKMTWSSYIYKEMLNALICIDLGILYYLDNNKKQAKILCLKSLSIQNKTHNITVFRLWTNSILSLIYEEESQHSKAIKYLRAAEEALELLGQVKNLSKTGTVFKILREKFLNSKGFKTSIKLYELLSNS